MKYQEKTKCQNWATKFNNSYNLSNRQYGILIKLRGVIMVLLKKVLETQGSPRKNIDKLIIINRKIGVQFNNYGKKKCFLEIDDMIIKD